jgi:hypothetical protein
MNAQTLVKLIKSIPFNGNAAAQARNSFIQKFPEANISSLSAAEYNGGIANDSFCYNLEYISDLPFGIGGRSASKFGNNNNAQSLVQGIAAMISDARSGNITGLQSRHGLSSMSQDVLIKILSIYLPDMFITVGHQFTLTLLGKILNISYSTNDLLELNYKCHDALLKLESSFVNYDYHRLGAAIWEILSPAYRKGFDKWLQSNLAPGSGARSAYVSCVERLSLHYCENYYSQSITLPVLNSLYSDTIANQQLSGGTFYSSQPSYGNKYYYSSAVQKYIDYLKAKGVFGTSGGVGSASSPSSTSPTPKVPYHKNIILYGPPGTGKTYNSIRYAVAISEWIDVSVLRNVDNYVDASGTAKNVKDEFKKLLNNKHIVFTTFHQSLSYEDFIEGIKPRYDQKAKILKYPTEPGLFKKICDEAKGAPQERFVLIIDEINRGNVAQIFGELITLIEEDKREGAKNELKCTLPYSGEQFCVPNNLYIIGTMNTADRSVEALDSALRRRFHFVELMPDKTLVTSTARCNEVFSAINKRISILKDTEHQLGHSYFLDVQSDDDLRDVFRYNIIPLLQEYFFGDIEKMKMVLGEGFFVKETIDPKKDFPYLSGDIDIPSETYRLWGREEWENCVTTPSLFTDARDKLIDG